MPGLNNMFLDGNGFTGTLPPSIGLHTTLQCVAVAVAVTLIATPDNAHTQHAPVTPRWCSGSRNEPLANKCNNCEERLASSMMHYLNPDIEAAPKHNGGNSSSSNSSNTTTNTNNNTRNNSYDY